MTQNVYECNAGARINTLTTFQRFSNATVSIAGLRRRLLILGTGQLATDLCLVLLSKRSRLFDVVGFLDKDSNRVGERLVNPGIIGTFEQLSEIVIRDQVQTIVVCLEERRTYLPVQTLLDFKAMGLEVVDGHHLY
jgi:FlaA1/EpsC-like NDP-sugar epimerase